MSSDICGGCLESETFRIIQCKNIANKKQQKEGEEVLFILYNLAQLKFPTELRLSERKKQRNLISDIPQIV